MKMYFADRIMTWVDAFDVFDEIGRKLFNVKPTQDRRKLKIYDLSLHGKSVATIKRCEDIYHGAEIKHGARFVSVVEKFTNRRFRFFDLGFLGWSARGNFDDGTFGIFDANDRTVSTVGRESAPGHPAMRCIDTLPEFYLHSLTFALAIDVQVSEEGCFNGQ